jgi:hypothetical protein
MLQHLAMCHLGLEAHWICMTPAQLDEITSTCIPGPNKNKSKASQMRSFPIPDKFIEQNSNNKELRSCNIFLSLCSDTNAWALVDFARLLRIHIVSRDRVWSQVDFTVGSPVSTYEKSSFPPTQFPISQTWHLLWQAFPCGPDWIMERPAAEEELDKWRMKVLQYGADADRAVIDTMCDALALCFSGFGRHTANDFLYSQALFPGTPARVICEDAGLYERFKRGIGEYMAIAISEDFRKRVCGTPNSTNPFAYNYIAAANYYSSYLWVFRKKWVQVPRDLYNRYVCDGLLDPEHIIGESTVPTIQWKITHYLVRRTICCGCI